MTKFILDTQNVASKSTEVDINVEGDTALIQFGHSFTLRLDELNIDILRDQLFDASRELARSRCNKDVWARDAS